MGTDGRRRLLWVTDEPPDRALGGGNIRQAHLLLGVARRFDVHLVVVGGRPDEGVAAAVAELTVLDDPGVPEPRGPVARRLHHLWLAFGTRGPREVSLAARRRRRLRPVLERLEPTAAVVVASHPGMAALLPRRRSARWVAQLHHIPSAQADHEQAVVAGRRQRWLLRRDQAGARRFERWLIGSFDLTVVVSDDDRQALGRGSGGGEVVVVPNGVDVDAYRPTPLPAAPHVLMAGSFQYGPNVDGAAWFCTAVLPRLRDAVPAVEVVLAGRQPAAAVRALVAEHGVELHADVASMAPWFEWSRATVVPLRIGSGTRLKALESMAAGRPVVGTPIGLAGLGLTDGEHAHVEAGADGIADALARLLLDDEHAAAVAAAGRRHVEARHGWAPIAGALAERLDQLAEAGTVGRAPR